VAKLKEALNPVKYVSRRVVCYALKSVGFKMGGGVTMVPQTCLVPVIEKFGLCRKLHAGAHLSTADIYLGQMEKELIHWRKINGVQQGQ
jgi:hypothetical protein